MSQPWTPPPASSTPTNVPNYLIPAIIATLLCCLPLGVVSIIFATQVNGKVAAGDMEGALAASKKAKTFMFIAVGGGVVCWIVGILLWVFVFGMAALSSR